MQKALSLSKFSQTTKTRRSKHTCSIVFVHGLQGHPRKTWTFEKSSHVAPEESKDASSAHKGIRKYGKVFSRMRSGSPSKDVSRNDTYWLFDLLPRDCPNVRVLTFGYDSKVSKFFSGPTNQSKITDHASNLLQALRKERTNCVWYHP
jgi:ankyrin repeat domain-containing protein 50